MFLGEINTPISQLKGVGAAVEKLLAHLGIFTVSQMLSYWPLSWEDRTVIVPLKNFEYSPKVNTIATVVAHEWFGFGRMRTLKIIINDGTATASLICFNRPFLEKTFPPGSSVRIFGSFFYKYGSIQSTAFDAEVVQETTTGDVAISGGKILPVYRLCAGLSQAKIRGIMHQALQYAKGIEDELPQNIVSKRSLITKSQAIRLMHEPVTMQDAEIARAMLIFEELFHFQYAVGRRAWQRRGTLPAITGSILPASSDSAPLSSVAQIDAHVCTSLSPRQQLLLDRLPFALTDDQQSVLQEINTDMEDAKKGTITSMARLLQGDVGSGKTLIAFLALLRVVDAGAQGVLLAPTELLARQHAENAARLLEPLGIRLAFFTGNIKSSGRIPLLKALKDGSIDIVVGTHALFSKDVMYKNLRIVIVDEQHRFGVLQRAAITAKGINPHVLMMSATPIPRTLALTVFGDLDVSIIRTMPPGRKPIVTHLAREGNEQKVYDYVRRQLAEGRQAYFVYPLISAASEEDSPVSDLKSAEEMFELLSNDHFPDFSCALIHSKVPEDKQRQIMEDFRTDKIKILVATSVVEVGVDVPNATVMVIEHAERFGLSALHQLRGRVGRGDAQSYCFLVYSSRLTEDGKARLKIMHENTDGFLIAEEDLKLRGPGSASGIQQSGYFTLSIADPVRDNALLLEARREAFNLIQKDPELMLPESANVRNLWNRSPPFCDIPAQ